MEDEENTLLPELLNPSPIGSPIPGPSSPTRPRIPRRSPRPRPRPRPGRPVDPENVEISLISDEDVSQKESQKESFYTPLCGK